MALLAITTGLGAPAFAASSYFLYVVNIDQTNPFSNAAISQFSIGANGTLTALSPATVNVGGAPGGLYADPNGGILYLAQPGPSAVLQFTINNNGTLSSQTAAISNPPAPAVPYSMVIDPTHQYAYVENESSQYIFQYSVGANGAFTGLNPLALANGSALPLALHPSGQYAYASNAIYGIYQYAIGAGGGLTPLNPASVQAGRLPSCIAMHPSGNFVYVANQDDNTISQFAVNAGGTLSPLNPATVPAGNDPTCLTVHPSGNFLYLASFNDSRIYQYGIAANGTLTALSPASAVTGLFPGGVYLDPTGSYAYVPSPRDGTISQYSIGANGTLAPLSPATVASTGAGSVAIASVMQSGAATCTDNSGGTVQLGGQQYVPCPMGQVGTSACPTISPVVGPGRPNCGTETCVAQNTWSSPDSSLCTQSAASTCTDNSGGTVQLGGKQFVPCPAGQIGTSACPSRSPVVGPGLPNCATETCQAQNTWSSPPDPSLCQPPPAQCSDPNPPPGQPTTFNVGATETGLPCPAPRTVGAASRTCGANPAGGTVGVWGTLDTSGCTLPTAAQGGVCLDPSTGFTANCPGGTMCQQRCTGDNHCHDFWCCVTCWLTGCCINRICSSQSFCDP